MQTTLDQAWGVDEAQGDVRKEHKYDQSLMNHTPVQPEQRNVPYMDHYVLNKPDLDTNNHKTHVAVSKKIDHLINTCKNLCSCDYTTLAIFFGILFLLFAWCIYRSYKNTNQIMNEIRNLKLRGLSLESIHPELNPSFFK